jgi:competence protein ComEC
MSVRLREVGLVLAAFAVLAFASSTRTSSETRLTFLSVGQGDCTVFQTDGHTLLIDVGPVEVVHGPGGETSKGFDAGSRIVLPKLRKLGVRSIDLIILTHPDSDHVGGLRSVFKRYPNAEVIISNAYRSHSGMISTLAEANVPEASVTWVSGLTEADIGKFELSIAAPSWHQGENDNDGSLFVRIACGGASMVGTGDAPISTEDTMAKLLDWHAQVLKAGHHGSRTASGDAWIRKMNPRWAVISCGKENRFGHPHKSVLETYARHNVEVLRTDEHGDIAFHVRDGIFALDQ